MRVNSITEQARAGANLNPSGVHCDAGMGWDLVQDLGLGIDNDPQ